MFLLHNICTQLSCEGTQQLADCLLADGSPPVLLLQPLLRFSYQQSVLRRVGVFEQPLHCQRCEQQVDSLLELFCELPDLLFCFTVESCDDW